MNRGYKGIAMKLILLTSVMLAALLSSACFTDITPPVISGGIDYTVTENSVTINWTTNEASSSQVEYGTTTGYGLSSTLDNTLVTSHTVNLTGLVDGTTYHYRARSRDSSNNESVSVGGTFTTNTLAPLPKVLEKDVQGVPCLGWWDPELNRAGRERGTFRFQVEAGNRVEGEVALYIIKFSESSEPSVPVVSTDIEPVFANVRDPYGNLILWSSRYKTSAGSDRSEQKFPWRFSFIASTTGEFNLQVFTLVLPYGGWGYDAHLKVTVCEK